MGTKNAGSRCNQRFQESVKKAGSMASFASEGADLQKPRVVKEQSNLNYLEYALKYEGITWENLTEEI